MLNAYEMAARKKLGLDETWEGFRFEYLEPATDNLSLIHLAVSVMKGKGKLRRKRYPKPYRSCVVTLPEFVAQQQVIEDLTGCFKCQGSGEQLYRATLTEKFYKPCTRCAEIGRTLKKES